MQESIRNFFSPKGVALIGASSNPRKLSHGILRNMIQYGYKGSVYPVNPGSIDILGLKCYPDILHVPDLVDLAVIILPAPTIPEIIEDCGQRGIKSVTIISGGFKEIGPEGMALEKQVMSIANKQNIRIIGPNCVGTIDLYTGLNTTFIQGIPARGGIGFISQSGALCGGVVDYIQNKGCGFSHLISLGNEADITETDMIEYLDEEPHTNVIAVYVEAIRDGQKFLQIASKVNRNKPIIILKAGRSNAGARAVSSHTGSLAGSQAAYLAAFQQSGVIIAETIYQLLDQAIAFSYQPLPKGNRTVIITNDGGPAALASDSLAANGMRLEDIGSKTKQHLKEKLNQSAQVSNPIDMLGGAEPEDYKMAMDAVLTDDTVDAVAAILVPQSLVNPAKVAEAIGNASLTRNIPVVTCLMGEASIGEARKVLDQYHIPMYVFPESLGYTLGAMYSYQQWKQSKIESLPEITDLDLDKARNALRVAENTNQLGEAATRPVLEAYHIPIIRGEFTKTSQEAINKAAEIGYPVVIKVVSKDILHKSEYGGIRLGLNNPMDLEKAFIDLTKEVSQKKLGAKIDGFMLESMAPKGHEVIVGMRRDANFGPLMMFGLGGIYVELITDVAFRIAPFSKQEAINMIMQTKAGKLLSGMRGQTPSDIDAVAECLLRLSKLAVDFPEIQEVEINPLLVLHVGKGVLALDARIILSASGNQRER